MKKIWLSIFLFPVFLHSQEVVHLWPNGAPGFESRKNEQEQAKDWWVKNIHNPSIVVFMPPADKANGISILICPGGGHPNQISRLDFMLISVILTCFQILNTAN